MLKTAVVNLGCPKNEVDAEKLVYLLIKEGFELLSEPEKAEVIIVNTCAFIQPAVEEAIDTILTLAEYKKNAHCKILAVSGCLPQRYGAKLLDEIHEIDLLFGADQFVKIPQEIKTFHNNLQQLSFVHKKSDLNYQDTHPLLQQISPPQSFSYLKIAEGCNNHCSYCMIPSIKGKQQSVPREILYKQARKMTDGGVKEINIIAQDITAYGRDLDNNATLCKLLSELIDIPELERLRLLYAYPKRVTDELINLIAQKSKLCNYLDVPIQHISDTVLKSMLRQETGTEIRKTLEKIKTGIPDIFIRSTVMVGFPGESDSDFNELLKFVETGIFDYLGAFSYWPEDGSRAAKLSMQIPEQLKNERLQAILDAQQQTTEKRLRTKIGNKERILIEGLSPESDLLLQGRCDFQAPDIDGVTYITEIEGEIEPGLIVEAEIYDAHEFDLFARIL